MKLIILYTSRFKSFCVVLCSSRAITYLIFGPEVGIRPRQGLISADQQSNSSGVTNGKQLMHVGLIVHEFRKTDFVCWQ